MRVWGRGGRNGTTGPLGCAPKTPKAAVGWRPEMSGLTVAVLGGEAALELAGKLGKGTVEGDVGRHFFKKDDQAVNLVTSARYPQRVQGVSQALLVADHVIIVAEAVDRDLGLLILATAASGAHQGTILAGQNVVPEQLVPLVENTPLADWPVLTGAETEAPAVRELLLDLAPRDRPGPTRVLVEQAFPVKGVGTVVLGIVKQGSVKRHQSLEIHPRGAKATVRSIQVHDEDVDEAGTGHRVGVALRGVEADALSRGDVLCEPGGMQTRLAGEPFSIDARVARFHAPGIRAGRSYHLGVGLQLVVVEATRELAAGGEDRIGLKPASPLALAQDDALLLWDLEHSALRFVAGGTPAPGPGEGGP